MKLSLPRPSIHKVGGQLFSLATGLIAHGVKSHQMSNYDEGDLMAAQTIMIREALHMSHGGLYYE